MNLSRRQLFRYTAALSAASTLSYLAYRRLNRSFSLSVHYAGLPEGHLLRDRTSLPSPSAHTDCDILILGSGAAGLSALWYLNKNGRHNIVLAEGFERNGNNAAFRYQDLSAPSGAHYLALPSKESVYLSEMLTDLGFSENGRYSDLDLVHAPAERLLEGRQWQYQLPPQDEDSRRFFELTGRLKRQYGQDGRKLFAIPIDLSSQDGEWRALDRQTFADWLAGRRFRSPRLLWYLDYCCRDDYGQGIAQVSAFAGLHYFCARGHDDDSVLTWPEGLARLSEALRRHSGLQENGRHLPPAHPDTPQSLAAAAVRISEHSDGITALLQQADGKTLSVSARHAVCAVPLAVAARIVEKPEDYGLFSPPSAPWLIGNFVLNRFPDELKDQEPAWDNVVYGSPSLGYVAAGHQLIRAAKPERTIFTSYTALDSKTPADMRRWLLQAEAEQLLAIAGQDLLAAYGNRFYRHVRHVGLTVRGHAMSIPKPGYLNNERLLRLRRHHSRLLFAHSDLSGYSVFEEAVYWGVEAAKKILAGTIPA